MAKASEAIPGALVASGGIDVAVVERIVTDRERSRGCQVRQWPVFQQPRPLLVFMAMVLACALSLIVVALAVTPARRDEMITFCSLVVCAAICVEAMRRLGTPSGLTRDLLGAWWFPTLLLLPPLYSLIIPIPVYLLLQFRIRRTVLHRRVFNAASVALSGFIASSVFHLALTGDLVGPAGLPGEIGREILITGSGALLAVFCCALFTVLNTLTIAMAVHLSASDTTWRRLLWDREAVTVDSVEMCVGLTVAILSGLSVVLLLIAVPPVMLLQRSLLYQQLQAAARTDPKTGLLNAATWEREARAEVGRAVQARQSAAVLVIDIDHFKRVNDTYGHLVGDHVLMGVASTLAHQLRQDDMIGRFGGEEFVVLLPGADMAEACRVAERLRSKVGRKVVAVGDHSVVITVSIGVALLRTHGDDLVDLLAAADLALYRAKNAGRDRVCLPAARRFPRDRERRQPQLRPRGG
ncbi:GGDEF domain-containing protein [Nocardiopsis rhodophaea]|uniref:GGDEF domain-containing protein n=1 Tax=Nocardiopsis rhodophaea TaxID=280238 RepID=A0ABN2SVJ4_9ACTN